MTRFLITLSIAASVSAAAGAASASAADPAPADTTTSSARKAATVSGEYVEARTCDVWTGPCFANSEMNTTGEFAVLGWQVERGSWQGEDVSGLRVAAAIRAERTLCTEREGKVRAVVYLDRRASDAQGKALLDMPRRLAGKYLRDVVAVRHADIAFSRHGLSATLQVGDTLEIETIPLNAHCDTICGNEEVAYPSLARTDRFQCAKTVRHVFRGKGLDARWSDPYKRSAMIGRFSL